VGQKPQYVIRIDGGYYSRQHAWRIVEQALATRMDHKKARAVRGHLKRLGFAAAVEPACSSSAVSDTDDPNPGD
jgi:hypothetical protein